MGLADDRRIRRHIIMCHMEMEMGMGTETEWRVASLMELRTHMDMDTAMDEFRPRRRTRYISSSFRLCRIRVTAVEVVVVEGCPPLSLRTARSVAFRRQLVGRALVR